MRWMKWAAILIFLISLGWGLGQSIQTIEGAPLPQATATPRIVSIGGQAVLCVDNSDPTTCSLSTTGGGGGGPSAQIEGTVADTQPATVNPVVIGGVDNAGNVAAINGENNALAVIVQDIGIQVPVVSQHAVGLSANPAYNPVVAGAVDENGVTQWLPYAPVAYTTPVRAVATVSATPGLTPVVPANAGRVYLLCTNESNTTAIYVAPGATAAVGEGIRLNAAGATYEWSPRNSNLYTGPIYAAATQTTASLSCLEGSR